MKKITTHLWFDKNIDEVLAFYTSIFSGSTGKKTSVLEDTPSGTAETGSLTIFGAEFRLITAGPYFTFNPSISLFTTFATEEEVESAWNKLADGGKVLIEYNTYPWATKYGWLQDKYGLSWQLSFSEHHGEAGAITPLIMFIGDNAGRAKEAIDYYTSIFPDSSTDMLAEYVEGDGDKAGYLKHARFTLSGERFMAMDSSMDHKFKLNEAISFMINVKDQEELDFYWSKLSAVPESEQCGWCKDKFGVSWQIIPKRMDEMTREGSKDQMARVTQAFLQMKKFDIAKLEEAYKS